MKLTETLKALTLLIQYGGGKGWFSSQDSSQLFEAQAGMHVQFMYVQYINTGEALTRQTSNDLKKYPRQT